MRRSRTLIFGLVLSAIAIGLTLRHVDFGDLGRAMMLADTHRLWPAALLFFVAGILEGGFRQLVQSTELRFAIGGATGAFWLAYFLLSPPEAKS